MSKTRISRALPIATASALAWAVACSSAGNAAHDKPVGGVEAGAVGPPHADSGTDLDAGHGYTRLDDMEGTTIPWTGPAGTTAVWRTSTDSTQYDSLSPVGSGGPPFPNGLYSESTWSYPQVPTPYETFPGITSTHAARMRTIRPVVGGFGCSLNLYFAQSVDKRPPLAPVDLTAYKGVTFWAKAAQTPDTSTVRVELQDKNTWIAGKVCVDPDGGYANCFDAFGVTLNLTDTFTQYTIDFSALAQAGWGRPASGAPDLNNVYLLAFVLNAPNGAPSVTLDLWIDDLYFVNK